MMRHIWNGILVALGLLLTIVPVEASQRFQEDPLQGRTFALDDRPLLWVQLNEADSSIMPEHAASVLRSLIESDPAVQCLRHEGASAFQQESLWYVGLRLKGQDSFEGSGLIATWISKSLFVSEKWQAVGDHPCFMTDVPLEEKPSGTRWRKKAVNFTDPNTGSQKERSNCVVQ